MTPDEIRNRWSTPMVSGGPCDNFEMSTTDNVLCEGLNAFVGLLKSIYRP